MEKIKLIILQQKHLDDIRKIRSSNFVSKNCWEDREITKEEHLKWFFKEQNSERIKKFCILLQNKVVGFCDLDISVHGHAEFGMYLDEKFTGRGLGKNAMQKLLEYGFGIGINKIWGQVFEFNEPAIHLYKGLGFNIDGALRKHLYRNKKFYDVYIVSILREEYELIMLEKRSVL